MLLKLAIMQLEYLLAAKTLLVNSFPLGKYF